MTIDQIDLSDIYEFIEKGSLSDAPEGIAEYLVLLDKIRGMAMRIDQFGSKEAIVKHLILVDKLSRYKASKVYDEAMEYFYVDSTISKKAWINIYAEKMDKMINFSMQTVKDVNDASKVVKMLVDVANHREVHTPDKEELPEELFRAPFIVYSADAEFLGLPKINRQRLSEMIDSFPELTEKEKMHIKREALVLPLKVFPDEQENARKH
ncbi:MAG: hypothetical protein BGO88_04870 [Flavobacterium sp. 38-13]|uniref:hypothetical protein n=1 Tax=Flavobacterium sp. 38-13 TaxID=1896168 RepID=UPI0009656EDA|nr:hypothetical protein [Flavobacterium sp. 38-13]OJX55550.1 MAG: hypothetical protein BGO88_04870 [Flavobacterium sp. 38-13]